MQNQVIAEVEIEDRRISYYRSVVIRQQFNAHHEFTIRLRYDVVEKVGTLSLSNAQQMIGKPAVIKLVDADTLELAYEFRGLICEISMEQSDNLSSDLVLKGYSPTILLENGPHLLSFYNKSLKDIVQQVTQSMAQSNCQVKASPRHTAAITYMCQYRESGFHFINRLSSDYGEWFYYDGRELLFGKPPSPPTLDITYGEDVHYIQLTLRILPMSFSRYSYIAKEDKLITSDAPGTVDGLDEHGSFVLKESGKIFSEAVNIPLRQRVENKAELDGFVKKQKASMAANLEVLTGSSDNPGVCIGAVANVKFSRLENNAFVREDYGKFLITSIEHHVTENGKYYNTFEAIPAGMEIIPVKNIVMPVAESQIATVMDNKDPDNMGRVRVQMLWQQPEDLQTDWIRVMTPDAGGGKDGAKNRGLVVVPEPGDQVLVCFQYNDPNRPFVMGSMFHGKTGGGGGEGNKTKSLTSLSGSTVSMAGDAISIIDANGNSIVFDGAGKIDITCSASFSITCGSAEIKMESGGKIEINGTEVTTTGSSKAIMQSTASFTAEGSKASTQGDTVEVIGDTSVAVHAGSSAQLTSDAKVEIGSPATSVEGTSNLKLQSTGSVDIEGKATTNVKGGVVNLN
jgi:type VI secretion system secreted protein VgrG